VLQKGPPKFERKWDAQDVAVLACRRFIAPALLLQKGLPETLRKRLNAAFRKDIKADVSLWRRLGNTKYQLFNWGTKHNSRKAHKSRDRKAAASVYLRVASRKRSAKVDPRSQAAMGKDPCTGELPTSRRLRPRPS